MQLRRRVRAARRAADRHPAPRLDRRERVLPRRLADGLDDEVHAADLLRRGDDVARRVVDRDVGAPFARPLELLVGARSDERLRARARARSRTPRSRRRRRSPRSAPIHPPAPPPSSRACGTPSRTRAGTPPLPRSRSRRRADTPAPGIAISSQCVPSVCSPITLIPAVLDPRVDHDALARVDPDAGAVGAEDARLRHRRESLRTHRSRWLSEAARSQTSTSPAPGPGRGRPRSAAPPARRPRGSEWPSRAQSWHDGSGAGRRSAQELGLDVVGAAPAEPYDETERHILDRRARGLFAGMRFTMAQARGLLPSGAAAPGRAHRRVGRALLLRARRPSPARGRAASPATPGATATPSCARSSTRSGGGSAAPTASSSTRTSTSTARARRARRRLLRQEHDADHAPPRLLGRARHARHRRRVEPTPPLEPAAARARSASTRARRARSTSRHARRDPLPLVLDAGAGAVPSSTARRSARSVYGCDICQDVCPWNRGIEKRRAGEPLPAGRRAHRLAPRVARGRRRRARRALRPALRAAQRPALPAPQRARRARQRRRPASAPLSSRTPRDDDRCCASTRSGRSRG